MSVQSRPKRIRTDEDMKPETVEQMMMWVEETIRTMDERITELETVISDHETRISALE